ncbi:hypothetical protein [Micromonospora carbonacea]|uniref:hypothetical protein n=1 Tax=Micromonospora carbonacea TaxID=47853 RepID=UPI003710920E
MNDTDLHHLLNLADTGRVHHTTRHGYIDTMTGASLDDLVYAADDLGMVDLAGSHVHATMTARRWQAVTPRPDRAHPAALFHAEAA